MLGHNPNLELEIVATDRLVDIVDEGFDAGIWLGESLRDGMTAVKMKLRLKFAAVGSPAYFEEKGIPETPADLSGHICVRNMYPSGVGYPWTFGRDGEEIHVEVTGPVALHDHELMIETAIAGVALAYVWEDRARPYVESGRLISCLADWITPEDWLYLYYPTRRYISAGLRAVIDALRAASD
ncbi:LysR substrate-binding domain-containing protein [Flavisphingomonas formosensis]|uniref:LysR substrate-binding domain-containing protein n=1 Tax=Flavisphingomonas formosensis TaxID=861534 RepID=UPI0012FAA04C|nr:LysR substrate-binding domain-containing protein [Sphingomonas formosensis]